MLRHTRALVAVIGGWLHPVAAPTLKRGVEKVGQRSFQNETYFKFRRGMMNSAGGTHHQANFGMAGSGGVRKRAVAPHEVGGPEGVEKGS